VKGGDTVSHPLMDVVRVDDEERWQTFVPRPEGADDPPCRAETRTELVMLPE
jgi:hypothetical protein